MTDSRTIDLDGPVHYLAYDGPRDRPPFVLVHGLGGNHRNWMRLAPLLAEVAPTYALDMRGFGFTPLGEHRTTIPHNVDLVARFVREVAGGRAVLTGNSTGGVVSVFAAARHPDLAAGLMLVDAAMPGVARSVEPIISLAFAAAVIPGLGEAVARARIRRRGLEGVQMETLKLCTVDVSKVPPEVVDAHLDMARRRGEMAWTQAAFHQLTRSLIPTLLNGSAYLREVKAVRAPAIVLHGVRDRLVPIQAARAVAAARPDWRFVQFGHLGHAPMFEDPDALMRAIEPWAATLAGSRV